jgi:hypothetical protein
VSQPELIVIHNTGAGRFEFKNDGHLAVLEYQASDGKIENTIRTIVFAILNQREK